MTGKLVLKTQKHVDADAILDESDLAALAAYDKEKAEGKLIPWEEVKEMLRRRGVNVGRRAQ